MSLTGAKYEDMPHPASEAADFEEPINVPSYDRVPPESWETETRYITRFEQFVFDWMDKQKKEGVIVSDAESAAIFDNFFKYLSNHPVLPEKKADDTSGHHFTFDRLNLLVGEMRSNAMLNNDDPYAKTTRGRNFSYPESSAKPYVRTLFGMREDIFYFNQNYAHNHGVNEYIKSKIENKSILNIGGKNMIKDLLTQGDVKPKVLINIDPFIDSEDIDMNFKGIYKSMNMSGINPEINEKLASEGAPKQYDEIWASFSLPVYLKNTNEIRMFFKNIKSLLSINGVARIFPLSLALQEDDHRVVEESAVQDFYERKRALVDELMALSQDELFAAEAIPTYVSTAGSSYMLLIQRLK